MLFLCKVLLLIKQQHEFEDILLLEGMRKRRAQEADLFGGCASLRIISFLPLLLWTEACGWRSVIRTGGRGLYCLNLVTWNETKLSHESPVTHTFVWTGRGIYVPRRRDRQKSNSANYACRSCSIQTRKLCAIQCCGKSIRCSQEHS